MHSLTHTVAAMQKQLHEQQRRLSEVNEHLVVLAAQAATSPEPEAKAPLQATTPAPRSRLVQPPVEDLSIAEGTPTALEVHAAPTGRPTTPVPWRLAPGATPQNNVPAAPLVPLPLPLAQALQAYQKGAFTAAFAQLRVFVRQHRYHPAADRARFWMGECQLELGAWHAAVAQFERLRADYPHSSKAPEALLKTGLAYEKLLHPFEAAQTYQRLIHNFPQSAPAELALARLSAVGPKRPPVNEDNHGH